MTEPLSDLLARTARLIAGDGHSAGLKPVQWQALRYLANANRLSRTPGALAAWLGHNQGPEPHTVGALDRMGLAQRPGGPAAGRTVRLPPAAPGHALTGRATQRT